MTGKEVIKLMEAEGWIVDRVHGSHFIMVKEGVRSIPVPVHGKDDLGSLAVRILKQAGIQPKRG